MALTYGDLVNEHIAEVLKEYVSILDDIFLTTEVPCCPGTSMVQYWRK